MDEDNSNIVIESSGVVPPLWIKLATDANGQAWTDGKVHVVEILPPTKASAVTSADGNTVEGQLALLFAPDFAVCATAGNVPNKTVDIDNFMRFDGKTLVVNFLNADTTGSPTLNSSATSAAPIRYKGLALPSWFSLSGIYRMTFYNGAWNIEGDLDSDTNTTYPVLDLATLLAGTDVTLRTVRADYLNQGIAQMAQAIADGIVADTDVADLRRQLSDLKFQLIIAGIIGDYDTAVRIDDPDDIVLVSGMFDPAVGRVYI